MQANRISEERGGALRATPPNLPPSSSLHPARNQTTTPQANANANANTKRQRQTTQETKLLWTPKKIKAIYPAAADKLHQKEEKNNETKLQSHREGQLHQYGYALHQPNKPSSSQSQAEPHEYDQKKDDSKSDADKNRIRGTIFRIRHKYLHFLIAKQPNGRYNITRRPKGVL